MNGFTKLHKSILTSSIWSENDKTRIMWITMLASANANGLVIGTIPGMAALARMNKDDAQKAIERLCKPDKYSKTRKHGGARIIKCNQGWSIVSYRKHRVSRDPEKRKLQNRDAQRRYREKQRHKNKPTISQSQPESAQAEAEAEADIYKEKEKYIKEKNVFDISRRKYPGTKRGLDTEFDYFRKTHSDWKEALPLLEPAVVNQAKKWKAEGTAKRYIPHFKTWLYNRFWERTEGLVLTEQEREELKEKNRRALEAKRAEIRKENGLYFRQQTTEELQEMSKNKKFTMQWWLIKEILAER